MITAFRNIILSDARDIVRGTVVFSSPPDFSSLEEFPDLANPDKSFSSLVNPPASYAKMTAGFAPLPSPAKMLYVPSSLSSSFSSGGM